MEAWEMTKRTIFFFFFWLREQSSTSPHDPHKGKHGTDITSLRTRAFHPSDLQQPHFLEPPSSLIDPQPLLCTRQP